MPVLDTLYKKLAFILFLVIATIGVLVFFIFSYSSDLYQQEHTQKFNDTLSEHILSENILLKDGQIDDKGLKDIIHMLMVINPSIEVYITDVTGKILAYSAPSEKIKLKYISLEPIHRFLEKKGNYPIKGDDPRHLYRKKVFSVSPIQSSRQQVEGYLYVILAGEAYDSVTAMIKDSYILKLGILGLVLCLGVALLFGLLLFSMITKRVTRLSGVMSSFLSNTKDQDHGPRYPAPEHPRDEIDQLGRKFNIMADQIDKQINELKSNDAKRRELIANVSHDLRTPLTSLHGYIETLYLKDQQISPEQRKRYLQTIISHSERLKQLISELFELAKLDSVETLLNVESFSLGELIQDVTHHYQLRAETNHISINTDFGQELPFAYGDIGLIQRVLENLLDNALRHTPEGGNITVSIANKQENIVVKIADTGCGIPETDLPHIFDRFYQSSKEENPESFHSGLGLAIAKRILDLHGSWIKANSAPDQGTTFSFSLPIVST